MNEHETKIREHAAIVRRLVGDLVADANLRDDAAQDAWLATIESGPREPRSFRAWMATIVKRWVTRRRLADERRSRREIASVAEGRALDPLELAAQRELLKRVVDAVYELADPYRETLLLRYFEGLEIDALARRMAVPRETVRTRLRRGLDQIRARLDSEHPSRRVWLAPLARFASPSARVTIAARIAAGVLIATVGALALVPRWLDRPRREPSIENETRLAAPALATTAEPTDSTTQRERVDSANLPLPISGRVIDEHGAPVSGADVRLFDAAARGVGNTPSNALRVATTTTDGRFELPAHDGANFVASIAAHGFGSRTVPIAGSGDCGEIALRAAFAIHGVVRDLDRHPIAGATLRYRTLRFVVEEELTATSDEEGRYRIDGASDPSLEEWDGATAIQLWAEHPEFAPVFESYSRLEGFDDSGDLRIDLWLPRGATIEGRVLDAETGQGVPNTTVTLRGSGTHNVFVADRIVESSFWRPVLATATSDATGRYQLRRVPTFAVHRIGHHHVAEGERTLGYLSAESESALPVDRSIEVRVPDEGAVVTHDLRVLATGGIRGRLVDPSGSPVANHVIAATVDAIGDESGAERIPKVFSDAESDDAGRFELRIPLRRHVHSRVVVSARSLSGARSEITNETARAGVVVDIGDLMLEPSSDSFVLATVSVLDDAERPISDARIEAIEVERGTETDGWDFARARTDASGVARLTVGANVRSEVSKFRLRVEALGHERTLSAPIEIAEVEAKGPSEFRLRLPRARIEPPTECRVEPRIGARVRVSLRDAVTGAPILHPRSMGIVDDRGRDDRGFRAIEPGVYEFPNVAPGEVRLFANVDGYAAHPPAPFLAPESGLVEFSLVLERGVTLRGIVRARGGASLAGARLFLHPIGVGRYAHATLDASQTFEFTSVRPGERYRVELLGAHDGFFVAPSETSIEIPSGPSSDITIDVVPAGYVFVQSQDPRLDMGAGSAGSESTAREFAHRTVVVAIDVSGVEVARRRCVARSTGMPLFLPYGDYVLRLLVPGEPPLEQSVRVADSSKVDVVFPKP